MAGDVNTALLVAVVGVGSLAVGLAVGLAYVLAVAERIKDKAPAAISADLAAFDRRLTEAQLEGAQRAEVARWNEEQLKKLTNRYAIHANALTALGTIRDRAPEYQRRTDRAFSLAYASAKLLEEITKRYSASARADLAEPIAGLAAVLAPAPVEGFLDLELEKTGAEEVDEDEEESGSDELPSDEWDSSYGDEYDEYEEDREDV